MENSKILIKLSYYGKNFCGYQVQPNGRTVQGELTRAAMELFGYDCDVTGCSRTDSGVHANIFCATVTKKGLPYLETQIALDKIPIAFCAHLPEDISVYGAEAVPDDFHARYGVKSKEYIYRIFNRRIRSPFEDGRSWHLPKPLDVDIMNKAAAHYAGTHDFTSFMTADVKEADNVRTVKYATVERDGDAVVFRVCADGFLYHMVRIMVGTLVEVSEGKIQPEDIPLIISARDRSRAGMTAPAEGLYLNRVDYSEENS